MTLLFFLIALSASGSQSCPPGRLADERARLLEDEGLGDPWLDTLAVAKALDEPMNPADSQRLRKLADKLAQWGVLDVEPAELVRQARVRASVHDNAGQPFSIQEEIFPTVFPAEPRPLPVVTTRIKSTYVRSKAGSFGEISPHPDLIEAAPKFGHALDIHYVGDPKSIQFEAPAGRYAVKDRNVAFYPPRPLPFSEIDLRVGTPSERLAETLIPGEHATQIAKGGMNTVYLTHPRVPPEVADQGALARLEWAFENKHRLVKVLHRPELVPGLVRRDYGMTEVSRQLAERVTFDGKPLIRVIDKSEVAHMSKGVTAEPLIQGMTAFDIHKHLSQYFDPQCSAACKESIREYFTEQHLLSPEEMAAREGALAQAYRDFYQEALNFQRANSLQGLANWAKDDLQKLEAPLDFNRGQNHIWNPKTRTWDEIDR
jgi:hypothetical protein